MMAKTKNVGAVVVCKPELAKIDLSNGKGLQDELEGRRVPGGRMVLDLGSVRFVDSSGLGRLVAFLRSSRESGSEVRLCSVQSPVMALFKLVSLSEIVGIDEDEAASLAAFDRGAGT